MLRVCSLFSGAGGTDLGFVGGFKHLGVVYEKLPFEIVWANDIDPDAASTYKANQKKYFGKHEFVEGDIREIDPNSIPNFDVLVAGFPCQPFSNAGNRRGVNDDRGTLFHEVERFIQAKSPKAFVLENVKGILSVKMPDGTAVTDEIKNRLTKVKLKDGTTVKYRIASPKLLKAEKYGVPQQRHRVLIIGIREDCGEEFNFDTLDGYVKPQSLKKLTLKEVLRGLDEKADQREVWGFSPQASRMVPMITRSWKDIPYEFLPERLKKIRDQMQKYRSPNFYRRFNLEEINGTITASAQPENCGIIHPLEHRRYSVREIARIQSFPDSFKFEGRAISDKYKVIGNAVPPVLAHVIANSIYKHLKNTD